MIEVVADRRVANAQKEPAAAFGVPRTIFRSSWPPDAATAQKRNNGAQAAGAPLPYRDATAAHPLRRKPSQQWASSTIDSKIVEDTP